MRMLSYTLPLSSNSRWSHCRTGEASGVSISGQAQFDGFVVTELAVRGTASRDTCVFFSDLHWIGENPPLYERMATVMNASEADWILFGGDACAFMDTMGGALSWLGGLRARKGKLAVLGNREAHIEWHSSQFWREIYSEAGYELLRNEARVADSLSFYGVDDFRYGTPDWSGLPTGGFCISLSHNPDAVAEWDGPVGNLALCGHTHGGQMVWPALGPLYTSSKYGRQFLCGMSVRDDGALEYTSSGVGESGFGILHRRVNCPREILRIRFIGD